VYAWRKKGPGEVCTGWAFKKRESERQGRFERNQTKNIDQDLKLEIFRDI
jgi:hypothetical protein